MAVKNPFQYLYSHIKKSDQKLYDALDRLFQGQQSTTTVINQGGGSGGGSGDHFIINEVPTGLVNGINVNYSLSQTPTSSSDVLLYVNGVLQHLGVDVLFTGANFAMSRPPVGDDYTMRATYRIASGSGGGGGGGGSSSPLTTKGDIYTYAGTNARLAVGADGTLLIADSTQTTGLVWRALVAADIPSLPESKITNLVSDLAALTSSIAAKAASSRLINTTAPLSGGGDLSADRTLSIADATSSTKGVVKPDNTTITISGGVISSVGGGGSSPLTTKGDLYTRSASADARLAIGANGTILIADSTQTTGQIWRVLAASDIPNLTESQITNLVTDLAAKAIASRLINTTAPLTGGGDLTADRTLAVSNATSSTKGVVQPDNSTITIASGVISAVAGLTNPMTTIGDIIYGGASGVPTRLAAGTSGQILQTNGAAAPSWVTPSGGGNIWPFSFSTPSTGWSWLNQNVAGSTNTLDTSSNNIVLTTNGAGDGLASYVRTKIASTFTITTAFVVQPGLQSSTTVYCAGGLILTDGTKFIVLNILIYNGNVFLNGAKWTNATTFSAAVTGFTANSSLGNGGYMFCPLVFFRITETASARNYYISPDYRTWLLISSTSNTDFLTTTKYGVFIRAAGNQVAAMTSYSFTEATP